MTSTTTAVATVDREATIKEMVKLVDEYGPTAIAKLDHFARAFRLADAVQKFRFVVRSAMPMIRPLQGTALGFLTDKDRDGGYPDKVIEEAATEALMRGLTLDGNQWNIIAGRCYVTKNGMGVIVGRLPGLTDLNLSPGIPQFAGIGAVIDFSADWKMDGTPQKLTRKIVVKCRPGEVDAALGKATRKMLAAIYEKVTGSAISEGETEELIPAERQLSQPPRVVQATPVDIGEAFAKCKTLEELGVLWNGLNGKDKQTHLAAKDKRKAELAAEGEQSLPPNGTSVPTAVRATAFATTTSSGSPNTAPKTELPKVPKSGPTPSSVSDLAAAVAVATSEDETHVFAILFSSGVMGDCDSLETASKDQLALADHWLRERAKGGVTVQ